MKVTNSNNNLVFDDSNPLCAIKVTSSQGQTFAFITCLDIGAGDYKPKKSDQRKYWGVFSYEHQEASIKGILDTGGKWSRFEG